MAVLKVSTFLGEWPKIAGVKLPDGYASMAVNIDSSSGILRGLMSDAEPMVGESPKYPRDTKYMMFYDSTTTFEWKAEADAVKSPIGNDRLYWSDGSRNLQFTDVAKWGQLQYNPTRSKVLTAAKSGSEATSATDFSFYTFNLGVPQPAVPPSMYEVLPVIGHLVAKFDLSIANERVGGALTELTSLTDPTHYTADPEASDNNLMQSVTYSVLPASTEYVLAKAGKNSANNILRRGYALWRDPNTGGVYAGGAEWTEPEINGKRKGNYCSPTLYGKFYINGQVASAKMSPSGLEVPDTITGGVEVDAYYADGGSTLYFKLPDGSDLASSDFISDVLCPHLAVDAPSETWFDPQTETLRPFVDAKITFQRCIPREAGQASSTWYYHTDAYNPAAANTKKQANIGSLSDTASIAYKVALTPVVANDTDGPSSADSLGPVLIMDAWLAERDQPVADDNQQSYGKLTGRLYSDGETGLFVDDMLYKYYPAGQKALLLTKLTKVRAVFRLDGKHTIPEQLSAVTANLALPDIKTLVNSAPLGANNEFNISLQTKYEITEARSYVFTVVNEYGEEGPPSSPLTITDVPKDGRIALKMRLPTWDIARYAPIQTIRVYRTATGASGTAFLFAGEWRLGNADGDNATVNSITGLRLLDGDGVNNANLHLFVTYTQPYLYDPFLSGSNGLKGNDFIYAVVVDYKRTDELGEPLSTQNYYPPPWPGSAAGPLKGLCVMHNGILAAFEGDNIWFSEPYLPYAWNPSSVQKLPNNVVAILPTESALFAATRGEPFLISGNSPESFTNMRIPANQSGVSKNGVAVVGDMVVYASPDGLVQVRGLNTSLDMSSRLFSRINWQSMFNSGMLDTLDIAVQDNWVLVSGYSETSNKGITALFDMTADGGVVRLLESNNSGSYDQNFVTRMVSDPYTDTLHLIRKTQGVSQFMAGTTRRPFHYMTRRLALPKPTTMSVLQVLGNGTVTATVRLFAASPDTDLSASTLVTSQEMILSEHNFIRLPDGAHARYWLVEVVGSAGAEIFDIILASSMGELKSV